MTIWLIISLVALAACLYLAQVHRIRTKRREHLNLPRIENNWSSLGRDGLPRRETHQEAVGRALGHPAYLPRREKDWRNDPAVAWSDARYYNRVRGRGGRS